MSTANLMANLQAHLAILDLLNRYTDAVNQRDWVELENVFAVDGVWDMGGPAAGPMAMRFEGAKRVADGIAAALSSAEMCVQANHAPVVKVQGQRATARSTLQEIVRSKGGGGMMMLGTYHDDLVLCDDGEWRFQERRFRMTYVDMTPLNGQVMG